MHAFVLPLVASMAYGASVNAFRAPGAASATAACRGSCTHELVGSATDSAATLAISGPSHMVSDITSAAEWEILACPTSWPERGSATIRLVCTAAEGVSAASCGHVTEEGAVNTIVRMPASCKTGPFARIAAWDVAADQSIPSDFAAKFAGAAFVEKVGGEGAKVQVMQATLDYKFRLIPPERGEIEFDVRASPDPEIRKRLNSMYDVPNVVREFHRPAPSPAVDAAGAPVDDFGIHLPGLPSISIPDIPLPTLPSISIPDIPLPTLPSISIPDIPLPTLPSISLPHIPIPTSLPHLPDLSGGIHKSDGLQVLNLHKNVSLFDTDLSCHFGRTSFDASASVSAALDMDLNAGYAFKMAGKLTPPKVTEFALAGVMSGNLKAEFNVDFYLEGDFFINPTKLADIGIIPGLSIPGIIKLGPSIALDMHTEVSVDIQMNAVIPMTWQFQRVEFVFPPDLAPPVGDGDNSKNTNSFQLNLSPGDMQGSLGIHLMPKLEFGINVLEDLADAEVFVGIDVDATFNMNGTIHEDFSMDGCQDLSIGAEVQSGVTSSLFGFFTKGTYKPLYSKRDTLFSHCSKGVEGPATAIYDNGDGTYSNANGDLVNENGQLIDDSGAVIPDDEAADAAPPPVIDENGQPVPDEDVIFDNGDGTFSDAQGNPVNADGQRIADSGAVMGCDLDTSDLVDENGQPIPPEEAIFDNGDGTYSNANCQLVNADGQLIDADGNVIDYEPVTDASGAQVPASDVVIQNDDGTYSDAYGNPVDQYGGAMDFDADGNLIPVTPTAATPEDDTQEPADPEVTTDPTFTIYSPDELKSMAEALIAGSTLPPLPSQSTTSTTTTDAPSSESTSTSVASTSTANPHTAMPPPPPPVHTTAPADPHTTAPADPHTLPVDPHSAPADPTETEPITLQPNPHPTHGIQPPMQAPAPMRRVVKRSAIPTRRVTLEKRSFGCYPPSIAGQFMPPITGVDQLARFI